MMVKTSSDEKQRKRYGSLNRNEFRREEDDDVSLDRICSKRILEDTRFAFVGIPSSGTKISHVSRDHEIVRIIIINSLSLSLGSFVQIYGSTSAMIQILTRTDHVFLIDYFMIEPWSRAPLFSLTAINMDRKKITSDRFQSEFRGGKIANFLHYMHY